jgi:hypothetical protein
VNTRKQLLLTCFVLWIAIVIAAYFVVHKPWPVMQSLAPVGAVLDLFLSLGVVLVCGAFGRWLIGPLGMLSDLENAAVHLAIGLGTVSIGILFLGLLGALRTWLAWVSLVVGLVLLRRHVLGWARNFLVLRNEYSRAGKLARFAAWTSTFLIFTSLLYALAPPLKWDSLVYHLELPRQYLSSGRIEFINDNTFIGYPQLAEMLFTWGMALRSASTATAMGWFVGVIGLLGMGGFAGRIFGTRATFLTPAILLSGVSISWGLSWAYVDLWVLLFGLCMLISLDSFARSRKSKWVFLAGLFAGFSLSSKYTAGTLMLLGALLLMYEWVHSRYVQRGKTANLVNVGNRQTPPDRESYRFIWIVVFVLIAVAVFSPWLIKNLMLTQSPTYPFIFTGREMDELRLSFYTGERTDQQLIDDLLIPWDATVFGIEGKFGHNASIGPLLLALIPSIAIGFSNFTKTQKDTIRRFLVTALGAWIIWAIVSHISGPLSRSRHFFGIFPAFAILAVAGFEGLAKIKLPQIRVSRVAGSLVVLSFLLVVLSEIFTFFSINPAATILGSKSTSEYLSQELGWFSPVMDSINELPEGSRVQFFWEARGFYCQIECSADVIIDRWWHLRRLTNTGVEIAQILESQGITHVLIYEVGADYVRDSSKQFELEDWSALDEFRNEQLTLINDFEGIYTLYRLAD